LIIAFCGIDGSGKSTLIGALSRRLRERGVPVLQRRLTEPADPCLKFLKEASDQVRLQSLCDVLAVNRLLFYRRQLPFWSALSRAGGLVMLDRFLYTDVAYTQAHGADSALPEWILSHCDLPDLTVYLRVPVAVAWERLARRRKPGWKLHENRSVLQAALEAYDCCLPEDVLILDGERRTEELTETVEAEIGRIMRTGPSRRACVGYGP